LVEGKENKKLGFEGTENDYNTI